MADEVEGGGASDLEALAGELIQPAADGGSEAEEELDLGALVAGGGRRAEDAEQTPSPAQAASPVERGFVPPRQGRSWWMPVVAVLGVLFGVGGVLFGLSARRPAAPAVEGKVPVSMPAPLQPEISVALPPEAAPTVAQDRIVAAPSTKPAVSAVQRSSAVKASGAPVSLQRAPANKEQAVLSVQPAEEVEASAEEADPIEDLSATDKASPNSVDSLLDEALAAPAQRDPLRVRREAALLENALPEAPSREDVTKAMTVLLPAIRGCAMGQSGMATAAIVVRADGRVAGVEVAGAPFSGTASGRCMEGVIRRAQFPRFRQAIFRIRFPFAIQ